MADAGSLVAVRRSPGSAPAERWTVSRTSRDSGPAGPHSPGFCGRAAGTRTRDLRSPRTVEPGSPTCTDARKRLLTCENSVQQFSLFLGVFQPPAAWPRPGGRTTPGPPQGSSPLTSIGLARWPAATLAAPRVVGASLSDDEISSAAVSFGRWTHLRRWWLRSRTHGPWRLPTRSCSWDSDHCCSAISLEAASSVSQRASCSSASCSDCCSSPELCGGADLLSAWSIGGSAPIVKRPCSSAEAVDLPHRPGIQAMGQRSRPVLAKHARASS